MSKKLLGLMFCAVLGMGTTLFFANVAQAGTPSTTCGDGNVDEGEECDDGNQANGDGCDDDVANGGNCTDTGCGNSVVTEGEQCDDGNIDDGDGCDSTCQLECGNGEEDPGEECDDGNKINGDGCDDDVANGGNCTETGCGNSVVTEGEQCDPPAPGACSEECQIIENDPQTKKQQGCINAVNKNLAGVAKGVGGDLSKCVKDVSKGKVADASTCLNTTGKKGTKATGKTSSTFTGKKCTQEPPDYAFTDAATVNAGGDRVLNGLEAVLGSPPNIVLSSADKPGAKCQAEIVKQYNAIISKWLGEANKAKKKTLKGTKKDTPPPAGNAGDVAAGIDAAIAASTKVAKAEDKATNALGKKCTDAQVDDLADCGGATTVAALTACVIDEATRAACEALEAADGLDLACPGGA